MKDKVLSTLREYRMLPVGSSVTAAVSGGADSIAMLRLFCMLKEEGKLDITLTAAHLNHGLRGKAADADEAFVKKVCQDWDVALTVGRVDVPAECKKTGEGVEECARRLRYAFLRQCAGEGGLIATAHTLSDAVETTLLHLARGCSLHGLCGISPVMDGVIRPLIDCTRDEVEAFCEQQGLAFVTDQTNFDQRYARNRVRHTVVPALKSLNPALEKAVGRAIRLNRQEDALLDSMARQTLEGARTPEGFDIKRLLKAHEAIASRALVLACEEAVGRSPGFERVHAVRNLLRQGGKTTIAGGVAAQVKGGLLCFVPEREPPAPDDWEIEARLGENLLPDGRIVRVSVVKKAQIDACEKIHNLLSYPLIDYDKICGKVIFRSRRPGDRFCQAGRGCTKPLKKLFQEYGVDERQRSRRLIAADDAGLFYLEGFGADERVAPSAETNVFYRIEQRGELSCSTI